MEMKGLAEFAIITLIISTIWFMLLVPILNPILGGNTIIAYPLFLLVYVIAITYLLKRYKAMKYKFDVKTITQTVVILFLSDLFLYPYLIDMNNTPLLPEGAKISADYFAYSITPDFLPQWFRYFIAYPLVLTIGLTSLKLINGKHVKEVMA